MGAKVPQNITREDRIIGPLTLKQFLYFLVGGGLLWTVYQFYSIGFFYLYELIILSTIIFMFTIAMSFAKVNGRSFETFLTNIWHYAFLTKTRSWEKESSDILPKITIKDDYIKGAREEALEAKEGKDIKGQLSKLSTVLDTGGTMNTDEAGGQDRIGNLADTKPKASEEALGVEDILED